MLEFVLFMVFSALETYAMFYLALRTFKIDIFHKEIVFSSLIMAFFSFILRHEYNFIEVDVLLQFILLTCFLWLLLRINLFYATIITGITYQAYSFIQTMCFFIMEQFGLFSLESPYSINFMTFALQILSAVTAISTAIYIGKKRLGFDFVPDKQEGKVQIHTRDKILFALNIPSVVIVMSTMYFIQNLSRFFIIVPVTYALILYTYLHLSYQKDRSSYEHFSQ
ncbi:hypothetical protein AMQ84_18870 [Paenibacillus riograndensis]|uniref:Uncharacterized protein n=1 Tax=Paenibacillus riograndensis TaxID=483937 RepID=A0A132TU96_9BACL|nr:hypothetical protein [Paenibacillus riograndensis]KWX74928.1 hypothetical protein AMQ84_18870 [Paenibacillus riograndensis]